MSRLRIPLFAILSLLPFVIMSQHINDCPAAVVVCDDENLAFNPDGPGFDDFADPDNHEGCIVDLEQNSAWYYFEIDPMAPPDLVLGFTIHPNGGLGEDYDWALYGPNVPCNALGFPIRCSSSSAACDFCPETGMGMGTTDFSEGPGTGDGFVSTLVVQPGQGFYLMIDNWLGTMDGFVLEWTDTAAEYLYCDAVPPCALSALAGEDFDACEGETSVLLDGDAIGEHGNETYSWSGTNGGTGFLSDPNVSDPTIDIPMGFTGTIIYTLVVTEDMCIGQDDVILTVHPLPTVTLNQIGPFCESEPSQTLTAMPGGGTWGGAATGNTFNPMTNGPGVHTVTYTYTDIYGCSTMASMDIEVWENPEVAIDPPTTDLCDSDGSVLLTASGSGGNNPYSYLWQTPGGADDGPTHTATLTGSYAVTVTDENGCTNTSVATVTFHPNPDVAIIDPGPICQSVEFLNISGSPAGGTFEGNYISPEGELLPNTIPPGNFSITYTYVDDNDCEGTDNLTLTIVETPDAIAYNNGPLCEGQQILLFGDTEVMGGTITFQWEGPNGYTSSMQNPTDATAGGIYSLVVLNDGCPSAEQLTEVLLTTQPDAVATNSGPYCNGEPIQLFGETNSSGNNITYQWTGPNGYFSDQQNPVDATLEGVYSLVITVDNCSSQIVTTEVMFNTPPDALASNTGPYCSGEAIVLSGNTNTSGNVITYSWTGPNGYTSSSQNPNDAVTPGLYQLIINVDGCNSTVASTTVTINNSPQPTIAGQNSFCIGTTTTLDAGAGYMTYAWSNGGTSQTLQVSSSGTYNVTVTDFNGCTGVASLAVIETASLSPVITGALEFCEGSGTTLDAGAGYTSYQWSTGETTQTIQVSTGGNFGVLVMDADGCSGSVNVTTTENLNPVVMIGGSTTYCIGGFTVLDAGAGYATYTWSNSFTSQTITVSSPGIYSVDVIDNKGCAGSGSVTVNESTSLSPVITGNNAFCENGSTTLNAGSGFATYLWSDGSMNQNLVVSVAGTYSVSVTDGQGCSGDTSIAVSEITPPSAVLQTTAQLCNTTAGGSVINLYDLVLSGDINGTWEDLDNSGAVGLFDNLNFNGIAAGDYRFLYTTNSATAPCPEAEYTVVVTIIDCTCPDVFFINANPLCNESDVLDLSTLENTAEPGAWSIIQTPAGTQPATLNGKMFNATSSDPGQYTLQFTLQNQQPPGCPSDFQVNINVDQHVNAGTALQPLEYCFNENASVILSDLINGEDANGTWTETSILPTQGSAFNALNGTFQTGAQVAGNYTFQYALQSGGACPDDATVVSVIINPLPIVTIANPGVFDCSHPVQTLNAVGSSSGPQFGISWTGPGIITDGNENTLQPNIDEAGVYDLTITNVQTGCSSSVSVTVIENTDTPTGAFISSQNTACFGEDNAFIQIDQVTGGTAPYTFNINNGPFNSDNSFDNLSAGTYEIGVQDASGCKWDTLITIAEPTEIILDLGPDIELELGENATIGAIVNLSPNQIDTVIFSPDHFIECIDLSCLEVIIHSFNTVSLSATVFDVNGCKASDEIRIEVNKNRKLYIPSVFSPNGDGLNDVFFIMGDDFQIVKIKKFAIYNRWGDVLHESQDFLPNDQTKGWDGYFKNQPSNPGVFVYTAEIEYIDGLVEVVKGDVTVVR